MSAALTCMLAFVGFVSLSPKAVAADEHVPGRLVVGFWPGITAWQANSIINQAGGETVRSIDRIGVRVIRLSANANLEAVANALSHRNEVKFAEPDWKAPANAMPNDPLFASQWHLNKINAGTAWNTTTGSTGVTIAILDTGCDPTHPDLASKYVPGWNTYDNNSNTADVYGHGTAVAGSAAAVSNNGSGVAAVAWNCKIMPMRISDTTGWGYSSTVSAALTWAADHGARVANVSYPFAANSAAVSSAAQYFMSRGGVVTISAGNDTVFSSAPDDPYILNISATDPNDAIASWSNTGNNIDLSSPGTGILTTNRGGGFGSWSGTSFSAPIVAGAAALVISANPLLTGPQVSDILKQSADDRGAAGWDNQFGWGRVNVGTAVFLAGGAPPPDTSAPSVSFSSPAAGATLAGTASISIASSDNVGVASVKWYLDNVLMGTDTSAPYAFSWNTLAAANGAHVLKAVSADAADNVGSVEMSVDVLNLADSTPPGVMITAPLGGSTIGTSVTVNASASDNDRVTKVEFWVDGVLKGADTTAAYSLKMSSRNWTRGSHTLVCKAYDPSGNVGVSVSVLVMR